MDAKTDKYNLTPALNKALEIANSRAYRDESFSVAWNQNGAAILLAYFKLTRCVNLTQNESGEMIGYAVDLAQFGKECGDLIAYLARAYGLLINPDCVKGLTEESAALPPRKLTTDHENDYIRQPESRDEGPLPQEQAQEQTIFAEPGKRSLFDEAEEVYEIFCEYCSMRDTATDEQAAVRFAQQIESPMNKLGESLVAQTQSQGGQDHFADIGNMVASADSPSLRTERGQGGEVVALAELRDAANAVVEALIEFRTNPAGQAAAMENLGAAIIAMDELLPKPSSAEPEA